MNTYYLDINGSDSNNGLSQETAWETLDKGNQDADGHVLLKAGQMFNGQLLPSLSGEENDPITFGRYGIGKNPVVNGLGIVEDCISVQGKSHAVVDGIDTCNAQRYGVCVGDWYEVGSRNVTIKNLATFNNGKSGVVVTQPDSIITNVVSHDNGSTEENHGIYMGRASQNGIGIADNYLVEGCTAYNNTGAGIHVYNCGGGEVRNNYCFNNSLWGLVVYQLAPYKLVEAYKNIIFRNERYGISINSIENNSIVNLVSNILIENKVALKLDNNQDAELIKVYKNIFWLNENQDLHQYLSQTNYDIRDNICSFMAMN